MGTRGVISAVIGGELKLANYGQWDHNREEQGLRVLNFLWKLLADPYEMDRFKRHLAACQFYTEEQCLQLDIMQMPVPYHLSRDRGAEILDLILKGPLGLVDNIGFAPNAVNHFQLDFDARTYTVGADVYPFNNLPTDEEFLA